jgi:hypothetical protein
MPTPKVVSFSEMPRVTLHYLSVPPNTLKKSLQGFYTIIIAQGPQVGWSTWGASARMTMFVHVCGSRSNEFGKKNLSDDFCRVLGYA